MEIYDTINFLNAGNRTPQYSMSFSLIQDLNGVFPFMYAGIGISCVQVVDNFPDSDCGYSFRSAGEGRDVPFTDFYDTAATTGAINGNYLSNDATYYQQLDLYWKDANGTLEVMLTGSTHY